MSTTQAPRTKALAVRKPNDIHQNADKLHVCCTINCKKQFQLPSRFFFFYSIPLLGPEEQQSDDIKSLDH